MMIMVITFTASMLSLMITISLASRKSFDAYGKLRPVMVEKKVKVSRNSLLFISLQPNFLLIMKIKEIVSALERFAPLPLQDGFDNAGLQIGLTDAEATGALLCLDVTEAVLDEAIALGYNLVISHHPLILRVINPLREKITWSVVS